MATEASSSQAAPGANGLHVLVRGLKRRRKGAYTLDSVSAEFPSGRITAVLGANGAGKSTLMRIIALVESPDSGEVLFDGVNALSKPGVYREQIGYVPQEIALFEELTARENLLCWAKGNAAARIDELISALGMAGFASKRVSALSGGMKRRVNLAAALLNQPKLLIMDEPFAGMDMHQRQTVADFLKSFAAKGVTQIISSHHPEIFLPIADKVMALNNGRVFYDGPMCEALLSGDFYPPAEDMGKVVYK